jgi:hypothetical protein
MVVAYNEAGCTTEVADENRRIEGSEMDMDTQTPAEFLAELFEFECCEYCGGDVEDHVVSPDPLGLPHAWCLNGEEN